MMLGVRNIEAIDMNLQAYCNENQLKGAAYDNSKEFYSSTYIPLLKRVIQICSDIKEKNNSIIRSFTSHVPDTKGFAADTAVIEERIRQLENENDDFDAEIRRIKSSPRYALGYGSSSVYWYRTRCRINEHMINELENVVNGMRDFNNECANIYDGINNSLQSLSAAINSMNATATWSGGRYVVPGAVSKWRIDVEYKKMIIRDFGKGVKIYNFKYIREIMLKNPNEVTAEQYAAMIIAFNNMNTEQKAEFIECAYIQGEFHRAPPTYMSGRYKFRLSEVFSAMVAAYTDLIQNKGIIYDSNNYSDNELIGNYALVKSVNTFGKEIYVVGVWNGVDPLDVTLTADLEKNDYVIKYKGSSTPYNKDVQMFCPDLIIKTFGMRDGDRIDYLLEKHSDLQAETLLVDIEQEQFREIIGGVADIFVGFADLPTKFAKTLSTAKTISSTVVGCATTKIEGDATNDTLQKMLKLSEAGNNFKALSVSASFGVCEGKYQVCAHSVNTNKLNESLNSYAAENGKSAGFTADDVVQRMDNGDLENVSGLPEFVDWALDRTSDGNNGYLVRPVK